MQTSRFFVDVGCQDEGGGYVTPPLINLWLTFVGVYIPLLCVEELKRATLMGFFTR